MASCQDPASSREVAEALGADLQLEQVASCQTSAALEGCVKASAADQRIHGYCTHFPQLTVAVDEAEKLRLARDNK